MIMKKAGIIAAGLTAALLAGWAMVAVFLAAFAFSPFVVSQSTALVPMTATIAQPAPPPRINPPALPSPGALPKPRAASDFNVNAIVSLANITQVFRDFISNLLAVRR